MFSYLTSTHLAIASGWPWPDGKVRPVEPSEDLIDGDDWNTDDDADTWSSAATDYERAIGRLVTTLDRMPAGPARVALRRELALLCARQDASQGIKV